MPSDGSRHGLEIDDEPAAQIPVPDRIRVSDLAAVENHRPGEALPDV